MLFFFFLFLLLFCFVLLFISRGHRKSDELLSCVFVPCVLHVSMTFRVFSIAKKIRLKNNNNKIKQKEGWTKTNKSTMNMCRFCLAQNVCVVLKFHPVNWCTVENSKKKLPRLRAFQIRSNSQMAYSAHSTHNFNSHKIHATNVFCSKICTESV